MKYLSIFLLTMTPILSAMDLTEMKWRIVNDSVMGGISESSMEPLGEGMRFSGTLSLENNGGFASVRSQKIDPLPATVTDIVLKVKGDGRTYDFDLRDSPRRGAFSYRQSFSTEAGEVTNIRLPLGGFTATSFGRRLPGAPPIRAEQVRSIGVTLADKQSGAFEIELLEIEFMETQTEKLPPMTSVDLIDRAIFFGVPHYNNGNPEACANLYEIALNAFLVEGHPDLSEEDQVALRTALAALPVDVDDRAWALRRELDQLRKNLTGKPVL